MKTIEYILEHYEDFKTELDDRFGRRFTDFLTEEQMEKIGWRLTEEGKKKVWTPKEWTEENVMEQLHKDVNFGWEKCCNERGISASLMADVVQKWCNVLENGLENLEYGWYGDNVFKAVAEHYGWELE